MKRFYPGVLFVLFVAASCKSRKAEMGDALKAATDSLKTAEKKIKDIRDLQQIELDMVRTGHVEPGFKATPVDSLVKWTEAASRAKVKWKTVADSLNRELEKY